MFQKLANFEKKISQRIATRKARKQALRKAKEDFKNLKKEIKESSNPSKFLGKSAKVKKSTKKNKLTKKATKDNNPLFAKMQEKMNKEKVMQKSVTLFISKEATRKNRLAILNAYKKYQVSVSIVASRGKDNYIRPTEKANSDKFNEVTKTLEQKLNGYGVKITGFERIYNQGGKTL